MNWLTELELKIIEIITEQHESGGIELEVIIDKIPNLDPEMIEETLDLL